MSHITPPLEPLKPLPPPEPFTFWGVRIEQLSPTYFHVHSRTTRFLQMLGPQEIAWFGDAPPTVFTDTLVQMWTAQHGPLQRLIEVGTEGHGESWRFFVDGVQRNWAVLQPHTPRGSICIAPDTFITTRRRHIMHGTPPPPVAWVHRRVRISAAL